MALTFIAPEAGVWRLVGELRTKRFEGLGPVHLDIFWRRPGSASVAALATWPLVPDGMVPLEVGPIRMERGNELALLPRCTWRQSGLFATFRHCSAQTVVVP